MSLTNSTFGVTKATFSLERNDVDEAQQQQDSLIQLAGAAAWGLRLSIDRLLAKLS